MTVRQAQVRGRRAFLRGCARAAAIVVAAGAGGTAAAWPAQPLTLVVPFTPGAGVDFVARQLAARLPATLGQPVVVENVPGASGTIGAERVVRAKPDGHVLLVSAQVLVIGRSLYRSLAFDPLTDLVPVTLVARGSFVLVVPAANGTRSMADLVAAAAAAPGRLTYASPGVATPHHLAPALWQQGAGVTLLHVPYKGTAGAVTDLLGGRVDCMLLPVNVALPHVRAGRLLAIGAASPRRLPELPLVPTFAELRYDVGDLDLWYGVFVPRGTPAPVVDRLHREIAAIVSAAGYAEALDAQGMRPALATPGEFARVVAADAARWSAVVEHAGIKGE